MRIAVSFMASVLLLPALSFAQAEEANPPKTELLWPKGAPGAKGDQPEDKPELWIYPAPAGKANGCGVVVCPGGGYGHLALGHEGRDVAAWFNSHGVAAFVLKYRIGKRYQHPAPLQDVQRGIRIVRSRAKEFGVDPNRIGVMGFSAGGHLASTAATHFDDGQTDSDDPIQHASCRPDFAILVYPVISFTTPFTHRGSMRNLLGENPDAKLVESLSNEKQITAQTPPTFLMHTSGDTGVPSENSVMFYLGLRKAGVPAELHIYEKGRHGFGLAPNDPVLSSWPGRLLDWMKGRGLLDPAGAAPSKKS